jgi:hypothetical protein
LLKLNPIRFAVAPGHETPLPGLHGDNRRALASLLLPSGSAWLMTAAEHIIAIARYLPMNEDSVTSF